MTIQEAIGVNLGRDLNTGEVISHEEQCRRAIEFLGGLDEVAKYIPFPVSVLQEKLKTDPHLNNTPLSKWDAAAGYDSTSSWQGKVLFRGNGIWELYHRHGITSASCSDGVCILKEAARMVVEQIA